jgi:hypothetical protein
MIDFITPNDKRHIAEVTTTDITRQVEPETMDEHKSAARRGGSAAKAARVQYEQQTQISRKEYTKIITSYDSLALS